MNIESGGKGWRVEAGRGGGAKGVGGFSVIQYYNKLLLRNGLALISW